MGVGLSGIDGLRRAISLSISFSWKGRISCEGVESFAEDAGNRMNHPSAAAWNRETHERKMQE
jgi:hypothetical protein